MPARIVARIGNWACWPSYRPSKSRDDQLRYGDRRHKLSMRGATSWVGGLKLWTEQTAIVHHDDDNDVI